MSFNQLDSKKQFLILAIVSIVIFGLYTKFRLMPASAKVSQLSKQLTKDQKLLKNPKIPEEPSEDIEDLKDIIAQFEVELEQLKEQSSTLSKKLPEAENQDLMLKISDAARSSRVRIVNNVPYLVRKRIELNMANGKKMTAAQKKKYERRMRKAMRKARRSGGTAVGQLTYKGELMDKLVNDFDVSRPLHALKIEGTYHNIRAFIEALQGLPWQVTVVKIDYNLLGRDTAQGYPQPLIVNMIIGA